MCVAFKSKYLLSSFSYVADVSPPLTPNLVPFVFSGVPYMLSGGASCPAVSIHSASTLLPASLAWALGFLATGGGTFFLSSGSASLTDIGTVESSEATFFWNLGWAFGKDGVSITTFLVVPLEKMKLATLEGDLWTSPPKGDVGPRGEVGLFVRAAVLRRIASCRFMEGEAVIAGGDFFVGEGDMAGDVCVTSADWGLGTVVCEMTIVGGDMDVGDVMIIDLLIGF